MRTVPQAFDKSSEKGGTPVAVASSLLQVKTCAEQRVPHAHTHTAHAVTASSSQRLTQGDDGEISAQIAQLG